MLKKIKLKSDFSRNVLTLLTGTTIAQVIPMVVMPILTRLYVPAEFGLLGFFLSLVSLMVVFSVGRYDLALVLPKSKFAAINVLAGTLILNFIFFLISTLLITIFYFSQIKIEALQSLGWLIFLIPIMVFVTSLYQILYTWLNRQKAYKEISISKVIVNLFTASLKIPFGSFGFGSVGLIIGQIFGQLIGVVYLIRKVYREQLPLSVISKKRILTQFSRYSNFPKYDIMTSFVNTLSFQIPILLLGVLFSPKVVGYFVLSRSMAGLPTNLLASSVMVVFREKASADYNQYGNALEIYKKTFFSLSIMSIIPFSLLFVYSPYLFSVIFGDEWKIAGEYTQILIPMLFLRFLSSPLSYMIYIRDKQHINLIGQIILLITSVIGLYTGYIYKSVEMSLVLYSSAYSIFYIFYLFISYQYSKGK